MSRISLGLVGLCLLSLLSFAPPAAASEDPSAAAEKPAKPSFELSGGIYLFDYIPELDGAKEKFEIYAFVLNLDAARADGRYGLHVQTRARDTKLRPFFTSTVWFQEAYAWGKTPVGEVHVGKVYRKVGIFWDDSFFGNVQYFNGLKLNPDFGAELVGSKSASDRFSFDYSLQYFVVDDRVNGSLDGREVASDPNADQRNTVTARLVPTWKLGGGKGSVALGLSGLYGRIDRLEGPDFPLSQGAADLTLAWGPSISYVEVLEQRGERDDAAHPLSRLGYDDSTYLLAGTRWQLGHRVNARVNYSRVRYKGARATETELLPGLVFTLDPSASVIVEYDHWKTDPDHGEASFIDKSWSLVLHYSF